MATIYSVLGTVDELIPNPYDEEIKAGWLLELDGRLATELQISIPEMHAATDWNAPLVVAAPYDNLYGFYVMAMLHFANQEYDHYNAARALFDQALDEYRKWYSRTHRADPCGGYQNL